MRRFSSFLLIVLLMSFISGCTLFPKEEEVLAPPIKEPEKVTFDTLDVKKGTIERVIRCTGYFVSVSQQDLYYKDRGGRLESLEVKLGDKVKKGQLLATIETDMVQSDIELQQIALQRAQIAYDDLKKKQEIEGGGDKSQLELAQLDVDSNRIRLESLLSELAASRLTAPAEGEVVYITDTKLGDVINAHQTVVRIADPKRLQVQYDGDNAADMKLGMKPQLTYEDKDYTGEVVMTPAEMPLDASGQMQKSVRIKTEGLPQGISLGSSVSIKLTLEKLDNVIVLQKSLVNNFGTRRFVNVLVNGIREERDVELGLQTDTEVEVVKGLNVGDKVIIR